MTNYEGYWKENVRLVLKLLSIWFVASYGMGILFVDYLNQFQFFGFPFGFWVTQQGAIYVFVALIFVYVAKMNKLDKKYGVDESDDDIPAEDKPTEEKGSE
jgi:putative solute:sodium symporter small subunit